MTDKSQTRIETTRLETQSFTVQIVSSYRLEAPKAPEMEFSGPDGQIARGRMRVPFEHMPPIVVDARHVLTLLSNEGKEFRAEMTGSELRDLLETLRRAQPGVMLV